MTHWVIVKKNGKIYAGVDELRSGPDYESKLSGTGTMPGLHDEFSANKLVSFSAENRQCVICSAGRSYPTSKTSGRTDRDMAYILDNQVLPNLDFSRFGSAQELLSAVISSLVSQYVIDDHSTNAIVVGCGFIDGTARDAKSALSIAYYDSRYNLLRGVSKNCLNSELTERNLSVFEQDPSFVIQNEIHERSLTRPGRVGRDTNMRVISFSPLSQHQSSVSSIFQSGKFSRNRDQSVQGVAGQSAVSEANDSNEPENRCFIM